MARECYTTVDKLLSMLRNKNFRSDFRVAIFDGKALSIGPSSSPQAFIFDFEIETLAAGVEAPSHARIAPISRFDDRDLPQGRAQRTTGRYTFTHKEVAFVRSSLADLLEGVLIYLERLKPGTLIKLSAIKKRTRRIVAREKGDLFDKAHLARDHVRAIGEGWFMGTNNSSSETQNWIRRACDVAGINYISDVIIGI